MNFLTDVVARKRREAEALPACEGALERMIPSDGRGPFPGERFVRALRGADGLRLIAELKPRSPSAGTLRETFSVEAIVRAYERGGASAISVLTDREAFGGSFELLAQVRRLTRLPLLAKDFFISERQLFQARRSGADAALLIARILPGRRLGELLAAARRLGLEALVEVHSSAEAARAAAADARVVGINARDLGTLKIDPKTVLRVAPRIPPGIVRIAESGIAGAPDVARLRGLVDAILVGTALMRSPDAAAAAGELVRAGQRRLQVKICGLTRARDAALAARLGATHAGFVFWPKSPRAVSPAAARRIVRDLPEHVIPVGVFVEASAEEIGETAASCGLGGVQLHGRLPRGWERLPVPVVRAVQGTRARLPAGAFHGVLLDGARRGTWGGSGRALDWERLALPHPRTFLAGGIAPGNVHRALAARPYGIDVASGVEERPGIKDPEKMKRLFEEIGRAEGMKGAEHANG